jgi:alkylation response protein AidB-like acyl-CoA dehydrogenase
LERDGYLLSGFKNVVLDAPSADQILISARTSGSADDATGISLFIVPRAAGGVKLRAYPTQDGRRAADIALDRVKVGLDACLGSPSVALPFLERAIDKANAALCAEAVGIMDALNEHTLEHLKARKQFGVPIGSFQALQHRMVDMVTAAEQARSMAILAAVRADSNDPAERSRAVSGAKAYVMQAARFVGQQAIQLHGGMGVVDELIVSHYFKRLTVIGLTYGDADHHLARFGSSLFAA